MAELTPMMKQYLEIKEQNKDSILFFRLGDFYEMFGADARTASRELDLTLTTRDKDKNKAFEDKVPMCGIPYHSSDGYIARLIAKGYKVAICEQTEDPATAKGLVKRDIIRVVTPGTVLGEASLEAGRSNFCAAVWLEGDMAGFAACDISTGKTHATAFSGKDAAVHMLNEVARFSPAEIIMNETAAEDAALTTLTQSKLSCHREVRGTRMETARTLVAAQFGEQELPRLPRENPTALLALGNLLGYLHETQKGDLYHIDTLDYYRQGQFMELDIAARRNLELTETLRGKEKKGSLLWVLDKTKTAMGARMLRGWLERPLLTVQDIDRRADCVERLVKDTVTREELMLSLSGISDMERLMSRIVYGSAGGRDLVALRMAMEKLPAIKELLAAFPKGRLREIYRTLDTLDDLARRIADTLQDEPPFSVREGEFIRDGFHPEVDRLRGILHGGKGLMASMEAQEKEKTGIRTLKIGYNKVFGYYIEVSNSFKDQVPDTYIRKQTLVNGERYITQELKNLESDILTAADRVAALEFELFAELRLAVAGQVGRIQAAASAVAELDSLLSGGGCGQQQLLPPHGGQLRHTGNTRRPSSRGGENAQRRPVRAQRHLHGGEGGPGGHHHRAQYGGQINLYAAGGPHCAFGADRVLRSGKERPSGRGGPHFHTHRRVGRPLRRPIHLHGGDDRGQRHSSCRHQGQPPDPGRDRSGHQHL